MNWNQLHNVMLVAHTAMSAKMANASSPSSQWYLLFFSSLPVDCPCYTEHWHNSRGSWPGRRGGGGGGM